MSNTPISAVVITFNEEKNIDRCLTSLKKVADEIVVVDSFSTDRTQEICEQHAVKFVQHAFEGHIEQKNWAITQAKYPHVLSLDADEELSEELIKSILKIKANWQFDGYSMNRLTNYCGKSIKHGGWYPDKKLRLWDSRKGKWKGINPHDFYEVKGSVSHLKGDLNHYSFYTIKQHIQQIDYFTDISSKAYYDKGKRSNWFTLLFKPKFHFMKSYIFRLGILDGYYGWIIAKNSSFATLLKYQKLKELQKKRKS